MIRKLVIAVGATAVIAGAAMAPTTASAGWKHKHHRHGWHGGISIYTPAYFGPDCYRVRRVVLTRWGYRGRRVTVCEEAYRRWSAIDLGFAAAGPGSACLPSCTVPDRRLARAMA